MATIKSYTDLEQSKKLADIISHESADMEYMFLKKDGSKVSNVPFVKDGFEEHECCYTFIPCWSLAALLDLIPKGKSLGQLQTNGEYYICMTTINHVVTECDNPIDACYEMILKLNELNLL